MTNDAIPREPVSVQTEGGEFKIGEKVLVEAILLSEDDGYWRVRLCCDGSEATVSALQGIDHDDVSSTVSSGGDRPGQADAAVAEARTAAMHLANNVAGVWSAFEQAVRDACGHTNYAVVAEALAEFYATPQASGITDDERCFIVETAVRVRNCGGIPSQLRSDMLKCLGIINASTPRRGVQR